MADLFQNAIHSIQLGIEDFESDDERRPLSAVRNYYSGLLLLAKQCLVEAAPEADLTEIIGANFCPVPDESGGVKFEQQGHKTVDLWQLEKRFKDFRIVWPGDINDVKKLQSIRNNIEHLHLNEPLSAVRQILVQSFPIVVGLFKILGKEPSQELGFTWDTMLNERKFFKQQAKECMETFRNVEWVECIDNFDDAMCPYCRSSLIEQLNFENKNPQNIKGKCRSCGEELSAEEVVEILVASQFAEDSYASIMDGGESVIDNCPECSLLTYVNPHGCYWCEHVLSGDCAMCSTPLTPNNISFENSKFCAYCDHIINKDD